MRASHCFCRGVSGAKGGGRGRGETDGCDDEDGGRVAVDADDFDWTALVYSGPVLESCPEEEGESEEVGVSAKRDATRDQPPRLAAREAERWRTHTRVTAAPRRVKS